MFFYFEHWKISCSLALNHFTNFGEGAYKEHFCEIILKIGQLALEMSFKDFFSIFNSWQRSCSAERNHFKKCWKRDNIIKRNISVELF